MTAGGFSSARPKDRLLIRGAKQIVTLQGPARMRQGAELREAGVLRDASILVEGGLITQVGNARRLDNLKEAAKARVMDARNLVIVPGFLDATQDLLPLAVNGGGAGERGEPPGAPFEEPADYSDHVLHTVARALERELGKLSRLGTAFAQFRLRFPKQPVLQSRILRNLLQLDLPSGSFRAELHFPRLPDFGADDGTLFRHRLPTAAKGYWKRLETSLAVSVRSAALREFRLPEQLRALHRIHGGLPCFLTSPETLDAEALLRAGSGSASTVAGFPPERREVREAAARLDVPWIVPGGELGLAGGAQSRALRGALDCGMRVAVSSGYDVNRPGCASPFGLAPFLRREAGFDPAEILQLSIANLAYALDLGHRLGSIQAGHDASFSILECEDYREIGIHLGLPPVLASFRRGVLMEKRLGVRE
ncbi:MAG: hypothetical protein IT169_08900 [Bryobacterales bacterium]|nr:hypothetical protein [Bryobacterales bacterium]